MNSSICTYFVLGSQKASVGAFFAAVFAFRRANGL